MVKFYVDASIKCWGVPLFVTSPMLYPDYNFPTLMMFKSNMKKIDENLRWIQLFSLLIAFLAKLRSLFSRLNRGLGTSRNIPQQCQGCPHRGCQQVEYVNKRSIGAYRDFTRVERRGERGENAGVRWSTAA